MIRHCDGTDPNLLREDGGPCKCGQRFDDVDRMVIYPHDRIGGSVPGLNGGARYCRRCDLLTGYGAVGVYLQPEDRDEEWLRSHCWCCGKPASECESVP